ncbi:MAG: chemotaxis protein CheW [Pseudomonadota bacterium]
MTADGNIRSLRESPFELLRELENRARQALSGQGRAAGLPTEWVGVGFRLGGESFLASRDDVREILMPPDGVTRVPGTKPWMLGLSNVRGQLLSLIDLRGLLGSGRVAMDRDTRVISVNHKEASCGLLVDEVHGFRRFIDSEYSAETPQTIIRCEEFLSGIFRRGEESWPVFALKPLVESERFLKAAS